MIKEIDLVTLFFDRLFYSISYFTLFRRVGELMKYILNMIIKIKEANSPVMSYTKVCTPKLYPTKTKIDEQYKTNTNSVIDLK